MNIIYALGYWQIEVQWIWICIKLSMNISLHVIYRFDASLRYIYIHQLYILIIGLNQIIGQHWQVPNVVHVLFNVGQFFESIQGGTMVSSALWLYQTQYISNYLLVFKFFKYQKYKRKLSTHMFVEYLVNFD